MRTSAFLVLVILSLATAQGLVGGEDDSDCCSFLSVRVGGDNVILNGDYKLKADRGSKPEAVCINGCIYTREGSVDEFCFKADSEAEADVQCMVRSF